MIGRLNWEIKRRVDVVEIFPNPAAFLRLATAVVIEAHEEWQVTRRYVSDVSMDELRVAIAANERASLQHATPESLTLELENAFHTACLVDHEPDGPPIRITPLHGTLSLFDSRSLLILPARNAVQQSPTTPGPLPRAHLTYTSHRGETVRPRFARRSCRRDIRDCREFSNTGDPRCRACARELRGYGAS